MRFNAVARLALGCLLLGLAAPVGAATWPPLDLSAFTSACRGDAGLQSMVAGASPSGTPGIERLCTCFAGKLEGTSQSDVDMLTKDLLGTTTDAERQAYETYEDLSSFAGEAVDACVADDGSEQAVAPPVPATPPAPPAPPPVAEAEALPAPEPLPAPVPVAPQPAAPMAPAVAPIPAAQPHRLSAAATGFLNACVGSPPFKTYLGGIKAGDPAMQGTVCSCMTGALVDKVTDADLTVLARDFSTRREALPPGVANYQAIADAAQQSLRGCMREAGITPDF